VTVTATAHRPDTHDMVVVHRVFRREAALLPRLVRSVPDGDSARASVIVSHFRTYELGVHYHHTGEDDLLWPLLLARVDLEADSVLRMEAQHEAIARTLAEAAQRVPAWQAAPSPSTADPLVAALCAHQAVLAEHLQDEEDHILPLAAEHLTVAEWARLGERFAEVPRDKQIFFLGAILEEAEPEEQAQILGSLPAPVRLLWYLAGRRSYRRTIRAIRADITIPPVPRLARWLNRHASPDKSAPDAFLRFHCWLYQKSGGRVGHGVFGTPCLLLTTIGRKTRRPRVIALVYACDGDRYVVAASNDARDHNPGWLYNLQAEPSITLQVARRKMAGTAHVVEQTDPAYPRLWGLINAVSGGRYDHYQARTARPIPVAVLTPRSF